MAVSAVRILVAIVAARQVSDAHVVLMFILSPDGQDVVARFGFSAPTRPAR